MYSTVIRQQHIIERTEQERLLLLLLSFIAQKYYKTKGSKTEWYNAHPVRRMTFNSFYPQLQCALEGSLNVVTERKAQFEC